MLNVKFLSEINKDINFIFSFLIEYTAINLLVCNKLFSNEHR